MKRTLFKQTIKQSFYKYRTKFDKKYGNYRMKVKGGFSNGNSISRYYTPTEGNFLIKDLLNSANPIAIVRYGLFELSLVGGYVLNKKEQVSRTFPSLQKNAGFFPDDKNMIPSFVDCYLRATKHTDVFAAWNFRHGLWKEEETIFERNCPGAYLTDIGSLNFFKYDEPWTESLEDKKVLVVHPFASSIFEQYNNKRELLFDNKSVLPKFKKLETLEAVQSAAFNKTPFDDWFQALAYMQEEIKKHDFDIALIGAGAYGLPLASFVKSELGKKAIHMGGVTQMLFGVRGKRWEKNCSYLFNEHWIRPSTAEKPKNYDKVEGGCYW